MKVMKVSALLRGADADWDHRTGGGDGETFLMFSFGVFGCFWDVTFGRYKFFSKRILPNWPKVEFDEIYLIHPDSVASVLLGMWHTV